MEQIAKEGYDPTEYIRWYNLRTYDRINAPDSLIKKMETNVSLFPALLLPLLSLEIGVSRSLIHLPPSLPLLPHNDL
jgi:hypothetical protein